MDPKVFEEISAAIRRVLPATSNDVERNLRGALRSVFDRLDLVTREELDVQEAVLSRTRRRVEDLEKKIAELEEKLLKK